MNIFVLSADPMEAAQMQCDKHVVKMVLETAQLLCSPFENGVAPYKRTHYNHPCAIWTRKSYDNYMWLVQHGYALAEEYTYRYGKDHKSKAAIAWAFENRGNLFGSWDETHLTPFAQAMPDEYKDKDPVKAYRSYYLGAKRDLLKYTRRQVPAWQED